MRKRFRSTRAQTTASTSAQLVRALSLKDVGQRLSKGESFVRGLLKRNELPAYRVGGSWRVDSNDLDAFIEKQKAMQRPSMTETGAVANAFDPNDLLPEVDDDCRL